METLTSFNLGNSVLADNRVYVNADKSELKDGAKVVFLGKSNILQVEDGVSLKRSNIKFCGNNSVIYLSKNRHSYFVDIDIYSNSTVYVGRDCYFNGPMHMIASEQQNIIIGNEGLFSFGIFIRTADPHLIYDSETRRRINPSASVFVGDHVWIGQNALILKGTKIGSGSIIGGAACVSNKRIASNVTAVGNPAKVVHENIFFLSNCVHRWTDQDTEIHMQAETDDYIYHLDENSMDMQEVDEALKRSKSAQERLDNIRALLVNSRDNKNRFSII